MQGHLTRLARAQRVYNRTWNRAHDLYGTQGPAPKVQWSVPPELSAAYGAPLPATVSTAEDPGARTVYLGKRMRKALSLPKGARAKRWARRDLLHEWTHEFQSPEVLNAAPSVDPITAHQIEPRELGAERLAVYGMKTLFPSKRQKKLHKPVKVPSDWVLHGQFNSQPQARAIKRAMRK